MKKLKVWKAFLNGFLFISIIATWVGLPLAAIKSMNDSLYIGHSTGTEY